MSENNSRFPRLAEGLFNFPIMFLNADSRAEKKLETITKGFEIETIRFSNDTLTAYGKVEPGNEYSDRFKATMFPSIEEDATQLIGSDTIEEIIFDKYSEQYHPIVLKILHRISPDIEKISNTHHNYEVERGRARQDNKIDIKDWAEKTILFSGSKEKMEQEYKTRLEEMKLPEYCLLEKNEIYVRACIKYHNGFGAYNFTSNGKQDWTPVKTI